MNIVNETVEHVLFGKGVITEIIEDKMWVQFQDEIGSKLFIFPEVFNKYLKAINPLVESSVLEKLRRKQEQLELDRELKEKEREAAELKERELKAQFGKKKSAIKLTKKKC